MMVPIIQAPSVFLWREPPLFPKRASMWASRWPKVEVTGQVHFDQVYSCPDPRAF